MHLRIESQTLQLIPRGFSLQSNSESAIKLWRQVNDLGLGKYADADLAQFICEVQTTGAKLPVP